MERLLQVVDDLFTRNGKQAPKARDIAYVTSLPELEGRIVKYRASYFLNRILNIALSSVRTWGAFNLSDGGAAAYAAARIGQGVSAMLWSPKVFDYYSNIYDPAYEQTTSIPLDIRTKLEEFLIKSGIPENDTHSLTISSTVLASRDQNVAVDLVEGMVSPLAHVAVAGENVPLIGKAAIVGVAYLGLVLGPLISKMHKGVSHEWSTVRTTLRTAKEASGSVSPRIKISEAWSRDNLDRYGKYNMARQGLFRLSDFLAAGAILFGSKDVFGIASMVDGAMGGFIGLLSTFTDLEDAKLDATKFSLIRKFFESGIYLPNEGSWDEYRRSKNLPSEKQMGSDDELCSFDEFSSELAERQTTKVSGTVSRGKVHLLEGSSGDGKTLFLYAMRGLIRSDGNAFLRDGKKLKSIYGFSHEDLRRKVVYYSPDETKGRGFRVVDMYADSFLLANPEICKNKLIARALAVDDAFLERQLSRTSQTESTLNEWEESLFARLTSEELATIQKLRAERINFARQRVRSLGKNVEGLDPVMQLSELSSGMRERILLDRALCSIDDGCEVIILDEPFGRVDPATGRHLIIEICKRIMDIPAYKRPGIVLVSNVHKIEIIEEVERILGKDGLKIIDVSR